eukprot:4934298-Amphidinium_carterae.1
MSRFKKSALLLLVCSELRMYTLLISRANFNIPQACQRLQHTSNKFRKNDYKSTSMSGATMDQDLDLTVMKRFHELAWIGQQLIQTCTNKRQAHLFVHAKTFGKGTDFGNRELHHNDGVHKQASGALPMLLHKKHAHHPWSHDIDKDARGAQDDSRPYISCQAIGCGHYSGSGSGSHSGGRLCSLRPSLSTLGRQSKPLVCSWCRERDVLGAERERKNPGH